MAKSKQQELSIEDKMVQAIVPEEEQPYEIPSNWVWSRLGNITKIIGGGTPSSSESEFYENGDIPWICPADLSGYNDVYISYGKKSITALGLNKSSARLLPKGTVLLSSRAPIGYVAIAANELCTNQGFKSFIPSKCFIPEYLYWYLKNSKETLESYASGTTFLELSGSKAALVEFPICPLTEQQRIVDRIESLFEKLDNAKELAQNALNTFETRKAAILHKAFTGQLTAQWREKNGLGMDSWEECCWSKVADTVKDKYDPSRETSDLPYIGLEHIEKGNGIISAGKAEEVKSLKTLFKSGDILYGKLRPYLNKHDISDFDGMCSTDILVFRTKNLETAKYLNYYLDTTPFINYAVSNSKGINLPRVSEKEIADFILNMPTPTELHEIVSILDELFEKEQKSKELCDVIEIIDLMKKAILARAFRGELGTNDPNEESAIKLLKECLK